MTRSHRARIDGCAESFSLSDFTLPGAPLHYAPDLGLEPKHLDLEVSVDLVSIALERSTVKETVSVYPPKILLNACL